MATLEELAQQKYASTILPTYEKLIQPGVTPSGAQLAPGFTAEQTQAQGVLQGGLEAYLPFLTQAGQTATTAMQSTGPGAIQQYMNPYIQQVADTTMTDLNRQFGAQRAQQQQQQIQSGGFAGSATRGAVMDAELARAQGDATAKAMSGLYAGGFDTASQLAQQAAGTQAGIAGGLGSLGQMAQSGAFGDVNQLFKMGEAQRQIQGAQALAGYQTPFYGLGQYAGALRGTPNVGTQYQNPNPILTGLQFGLGAAGMGG
tara:strand:- start:560 stop:1333 length:774 start_codon:yes stop_codon:yes gene_type:complete